MQTPRDRNLNVVAVFGLALGAVFGLAGSFVRQPAIRGLFWGIDGTGLVMAAALLTLKYFKKGCIFIAAGFLVFAIGEAVILSGAAASLSASVPSFAAGTALWAIALLMVSIPKEFAAWVRVAGIISFALFLFTALRIFHGAQILPISSPLPFFAYPFLVLTFLGWIWALLRENRLQSSTL
jgi:hypothetical protein